MKLLIDDIRSDNPAIFDIPKCDIVIRDPHFAMEFLYWLHETDTIAYSNLEIYLDHDMGTEGDTFLSTYGPFKTNGYGVLCLVEAMAHDSGYYPLSVTLVTDNASASLKMTAMLKKYYPYNLGRTHSREPLS